jgi:ATP-dependent HslUV protease ATP-binding subunit HslU
LFIASGAFHVAKPSDLIPELQGRFPIRVELSALSVEDFKRILTEPKAAPVRQMVERFALRGVHLELDPTWLVQVGREAIARDTGARALLGVLEAHLSDAYLAAHKGDLVRVVGIDGAVMITP